MPNLCDYSMKIVGKKEDIADFIEVMQCDYDYENYEFSFNRHMGGRVFEAIEDSEGITLENGKYSIEIYGNCAWSVQACMTDGNFTYYKEFKDEYGDNSRSTTLQLESERLHLDIEVYSNEIGIGFQEHYLIKEGHTKISESVDFSAYCIEDYETKEEAELDNDLTITDEEWSDNDGYIYRGGFKNYGVFSI
ncbi:hypothetical protein ACTQZR_12885 [Catenibacterium mitsuokai]|uniref:hypothetical protein n=1 Tax=Catenibacterium mitsuokai TaxID=100886 RepID=UPI003F8952AC